VNTTRDGLFEKEINLMGVQALGMGLGTLIHQMKVRPEIVTGHDCRSYSASIKYALIGAGEPATMAIDFFALLWGDLLLNCCCASPSRRH